MRALEHMEMVAGSRLSRQRGSCTTGGFAVVSSKINIPFNAWSKERIKNGIKTMTSRYKRYGRPGDYYVVDDEKYILVEQYQIKLELVKLMYWQNEGAESPEEFEKIWKEIHPRRGFRPDDWVWAHEFEKI
jgi:hypothetical protein